MTAIHQLSALDIARKIRAGELTSAEVTRCFLDRVRKFSDGIGAFVSVTAGSAHEQALRADENSRSQPPASPLSGVPTAVKDLLPMRGVRTTFGSAAYADHLGDHDANVVRSLHETALPILGKTSTAEFGFASYTEPDVAPPSRSPWDIRMSAGGSSGGSAAAVAAGLVPVAQGTDSAGSVRIPASMCGVVGVKASRGRVSNGPAGTGRFGLLSHGVLSRTVADAAALLDVFCQRDHGDPYVLPAGADGMLLRAANRRPGPLRVTVWTTSPLTGEQPHEECRAAALRTAGVLEELGHTVTIGEPPDLGHLLPTFLTLWTVSCAAVEVPSDRERLLQPLTKALREHGRAVTGVDLSCAVDTLHTAVRQTMARMAPWDVVVTPSVAEPPCQVGSLRDDGDPWASMLRQASYAPYTALWNCTGHPALSLPVHWTAAGLPVGVQFVGRMAGEPMLLSLAAEMEQVVRWPERFPDEKRLAEVPVSGRPEAFWC